MMRLATRWLLLAALAAAGIVALSFIDGWIVHDRELRGEGYRQVQVQLDAWQAPAFPILAAGIVAAAVAGVAALVALRSRRRAPGTVALGGAVVALAVILAGAVPVGQDGRISSVDLTIGWLSGVGIALAALMVAAGTIAVRPSRALLAGLVLAGAVILVASAGGRWLTLQQREQVGEHWSPGTYVRAATGGQAEATLEIGDGTFAIDDRWGGRWAGTGLTVEIDDDPACPGVHGAYHVHDEGAGRRDLRFVALLDRCGDGARQAELETGIWVRQP
jgi:hypothetical protein